MPPSEHWQEEPEEHDFPAAADYLSLVAPAKQVTTVVEALRSAETIHRQAKDLLRASRLPLLPAENVHVKKDLVKVKEGTRLSPVLLVCGRGEKGTAADGGGRVPPDLCEPPHRRGRRRPVPPRPLAVDPRRTTTRVRRVTSTGSRVDQPEVLVSSVSIDQIAASVRPRLRVDSGLRDGPEEGEPSFELGFRFAALQVGYWLGWASIVVVLVGLALDGSAPHRWLLVGATLAAAAGNTVAMVIPWREWLATRRGRVLLDLWCGGLIAFVALLVVGRRLELRAAAVSHHAVHCGRAERPAAWLLARSSARQRVRSSPP